MPIGYFIVSLEGTRTVYFIIIESSLLCGSCHNGNVQ